MSTNDVASLLNGAAAELLVAAERSPKNAELLRSYAAQIQLIASQTAELSGNPFPENAE
jgi:hypothetical protein